jgi:hypothetical protein
MLGGEPAVTGRIPVAGFELQGSMLDPELLVQLLFDFE